MDAEEPGIGLAIVAEGGENPLFVEGQPSDYTNMAMEFCNNFEQERLRTEAFVQLLGELDLFETRTANFTPSYGFSREFLNAGTVGADEIRPGDTREGGWREYTEARSRGEGLGDRFVSARWEFKQTALELGLVA